MIMKRTSAELTTESQHYLSVNTHKGQLTMGQILQGIDKVLCRIDDFLIRIAPHEHLQAGKAWHNIFMVKIRVYDAKYRLSRLPGGWRRTAFHK